MVNSRNEENIIARLKQRVENNMRYYGAEEVGWCDAQDKYGNTLCKVICFVHHSEKEHYADFCARALPEIKYMDIDHPKMVKTKVPKTVLEKALINQCCFRRECRLKDGTDKCLAVREAYDKRAANGGGKAKAERSKEKEEERKRRKLLNEQLNEKIAEARKQEARTCRAFQSGRCPIETCLHRHDKDPKTIWCSSHRVEGMPGWTRRDKCRFAAEKCPYKGHLTDEEQNEKRIELRKQAETLAISDAQKGGDIT